MKKLIVFTLLFFGAISVQGQLTSAEIDLLVNRTLKTFDVPGIAVCVIKDKEIIHSKGYGLRSLDTKLPVNENTLLTPGHEAKR